MARRRKTGNGPSNERLAEENTMDDSTNEDEMSVPVKPDFATWCRNNRKPKDTNSLKEYEAEHGPEND